MRMVIVSTSINYNNRLHYITLHYCTISYVGCGRRVSHSGQWDQCPCCDPGAQEAWRPGLGSFEPLAVTPGTNLCLERSMFCNQSKYRHVVYCTRLGQWLDNMMEEPRSAGNHWWLFEGSSSSQATQWPVKFSSTVSRWNDTSFNIFINGVMRAITPPSRALGDLVWSIMVE